MGIEEKTSSSPNLKTMDRATQAWFNGKMEGFLWTMTKGIGIALLAILSYAGGEHNATEKAREAHDEIASCLEGAIAENGGGGEKTGTVTGEQLYDCGAGYSEK